MINWKVRVLNKNFWLSIIPAAFLLIQMVLSAFGVEYQVGSLEDQTLAIVNSIFTILAVLGIVTDPTTQGIGDSEQALTYERPKGSK